MGVRFYHLCPYSQILFILQGDGYTMVRLIRSPLRVCLQFAIDYFFLIICILGFPKGGAGDKEPTCQCKRLRRPGFDPWVGKLPWRRKWLPTPVFLPGESHGQRSLVGYSAWGYKESDTTEVT